MGYLKFPWSVEDTIENLCDLKEIMQQKVIIANLHGRGEKDAEEVAFDFDRAINALKENLEYKKLGTLEEVRDAVEKQRMKYSVLDRETLQCPECGAEFNDELVSEYNIGFCPWCGQAIEFRDWSEE